VINDTFYVGILTTAAYEQAKLTHNLPTGGEHATWALAVVSLGGKDNERGYRYDVEKPDPFPRTAGVNGESLFTDREY
jgi:hypothetical protein